jgi:hypothetical protein
LGYQFKLFCSLRVALGPAVTNCRLNETLVFGIQPGGNHVHPVFVHDGSWNQKWIKQARRKIVLVAFMRMMKFVVANWTVQTKLTAN